MNISVRERGQPTARIMVRDLWLTDRHLPYEFHRRFDPIPTYKKFGLLSLGFERLTLSAEPV